MRVLVTGGTGFVGGHVVRELRRRGHEVVCLVRPGSDTERVRQLGAETVEGTILTREGLVRIPQVQAVIHLVGIIREWKENTFRAVHDAGTKNLLDAASRAGAKKFIHMSALGTRADAVSEYHKTKWEAEQSVISFKIPWTIFRPSIIFGKEAWGRYGEFVRDMLDTHGKILWLATPVPGSGKNRMQPVWVGDVARFFVDALDNPKMSNRIFELGGPKAYAFGEIQDHLCRAYYGKVKMKAPAPLFALRTAAWFLGKLPLKKPPFTSDQLKMLPEDNTCDMKPALDANPVALTDFERWCEQTLKR